MSFNASVTIKNPVLEGRSRSVNTSVILAVHLQQKHYICNLAVRGEMLIIFDVSFNFTESSLKCSKHEVSQEVYEVNILFI